MSDIQPVSVYGPSVAPGAYVDAAGQPAQVLPTAALAFHVFAERDGQLTHSIDGRELAVVGPDGFDSYALLWPACVPLIEAMRGATSPKDSEPPEPREPRKPYAWEEGSHEGTLTVRRKGR